MTFATQLLSCNHDVTAMTRSPQKVEALRALGAEPVVAVGLDRDAVMRAVAQAWPEVIIHQMTGLTSMTDFKKFDNGFELTNRLHTEETDHLIRAKARLVAAVRSER